jgi:hypothetical protein
VTAANRRLIRLALGDAIEEARVVLVMLEETRDRIDALLLAIERDRLGDERGEGTIE